MACPKGTTGDERGGEEGQRTHIQHTPLAWGQTQSDQNSTPQTHSWWFRHIHCGGDEANIAPDKISYSLTSSLFLYLKQSAKKNTERKADVEAGGRGGLIYLCWRGVCGWRKDRQHNQERDRSQPK